MDGYVYRLLHSQKSVRLLLSCQNLTRGCGKRRSTSFLEYIYIFVLSETGRIKQHNFPTKRTFSCTFHHKPNCCSQRKPLTNEVNVLGYTALHRAASWGHPECLRVLVANGADLQLRNAHGERAREAAARYQKDSCVDYLDRAGIDTQ